MKVYRIAQMPFMADLSGIGAQLYGGRWNPVGVPMLYCSESVSLCMLETLVHARWQLLKKEYGLATIKIPEDLIIKTLDLPSLPIDWRDYPSSDELKMIG